MKNIEIKTRIMSQPNGSGELVLSVKNGWRIKYRFTVNDIKELRTYLKSDEFKEYAHNVFSKYEGMTYNEMCKLWETDKSKDNNRIQEKLDRFAWRTEDEPFKITMDVKLTRTYSNGFTYRVVFGSNKSKAYSWIRKFEEVYHIDKDYANELLYNFLCCLKNDKKLSDKLSSYKSWNEFHNDLFNTREIHTLVDNCQLRNRCLAA